MKTKTNARRREQRNIKTVKQLYIYSFSFYLASSKIKCIEKIVSRT